MTIKLLQGSAQLLLAIALLGSCNLLHGQESGATPVPVPIFQPPAIVVSSGDQPILAGGDSSTDDKKDGAKDATLGATSKLASPEDDYVPNQAPVTPRMSHEVVDSSNLYTVHLRPLFSTGIKLPDEVIAIAVGAPSLIWAEHDKNVPRLIFVKPTTNEPVNSNIIVS